MFLIKDILFLIFLYGIFAPLFILLTFFKTASQEFAKMFEDMLKGMNSLANWLIDNL